MSSLHSFKPVILILLAEVSLYHSGGLLYPDRQQLVGSAIRHHRQGEIVYFV